MGREPGQRGGGSNPCLPQREPQIGPKTENTRTKTKLTTPHPNPNPKQQRLVPYHRKAGHEAISRRRRKLEVG